MSDEKPTRAPARPGPYIAVGILIAVGIVVPLIVPIYAVDPPRLFGIPFFYWYQLLWVFLDAGLLAIAFVIVRSEDRRRRAALRAGDGREQA